MGKSKDLATGETRFANVAGDTFSGAVTASVGLTIADDNNLKFGDGTAYIQGSGANDRLKFIANNTEHMRVHGSGYVTKPNQPAFRAWMTGGSVAFSANDTFVFDNTIYNIGSHYSTSTGRFTAPVAGVYHFSFYSIQLGSINNGQIKVYVNNNRINGGDVHFSPNSGNYWDYVAWNGDLYLSASDYVHVISPSAVTYHGNNWSGFTGHLVG